MIASSMVVPRVQASQEFGSIVHGVAVMLARKYGRGKSLLAERSGWDKSVIRQITAGSAYEVHDQDPRTLLSVIEAVSEDVQPEVVGHLTSLYEVIKRS